MEWNTMHITITLTQSFVSIATIINSFSLYNIMHKQLFLVFAQTSTAFLELCFSLGFCHFFLFCSRESREQSPDREPSRRTRYNICFTYTNKYCNFSWKKKWIKLYHKINGKIIYIEINFLPTVMPIQEIPNHHQEIIQSLG